MLKYTKHTLKKLEALFSELEYTIRYEKGNFQSGYCMVENQRVAVINKFFDTEGRINTLLEILDALELDREQLSEASARLIRQIENHAESEAESESESESESENEVA